MITVTQGSTNAVVLDVTTAIASPYFLIKFTNPYDCVTFNALFQNRSTTDAYYLIWIEEVGDGGVESLVNGQVRLIPSGMYEIEIYAQASSSNLLTAGATFIENNLLTVINEEEC
jgi:hypothetical protein